MTIDQILEIVERYKLRIPPTVFYELKADIVNFEEQEPILDKIIDEIELQETWLMIAGYSAYNVDIAFNAIKSAVNKHKADGSEEE